MSLLKRTRVEPVEERSWAMSQLSAPLGSGYITDAGRVVTVDRALQDDAVWACVDLIASSVASLPVDVIRTDGNGRRPVSPTPSLVAAPSMQVDPDVWLYQVAWSMATDGNAWGVVTSANERGFPTSIETLNPGSVTHRRSVDGTPTAKVDNVDMARYPFGDLWHAPGKMVPAGGWCALSPIQYGAAEIDGALAIQSFGSRFFTDGGHPSAIVYTDQDVNAEQANALKQAWLKATSGSREPAVFGNGWKYEPIQSTPESAALIESMRMSAVKIARRWAVPPSMIFAAMSGESITYQNVAQADLGYLKYSLDRYLVRIEAALGSALPGPHVVKFNRDALLRSDTATRYAAHEVALRNKWRTINEVRALEDEKSFDDPTYDEPGIPGDDKTRNLSVAEAVQKVYLGVGSILTPDEGREIINAAGGDLAVPGPITPETPDA